MNCAGWRLKSLGRPPARTKQPGSSNKLARRQYPVSPSVNPIFGDSGLARTKMIVSGWPKMYRRNSQRSGAGTMI